MQRPLKQTHIKPQKKEKDKRKPSTNSAKTAEEGSGDVRKTTPMPEKRHKHRKKMALVKPIGSTYARASVQSQESGGYKLVVAILAFN